MHIQTNTLVPRLASHSRADGPSRPGASVEESLSVSKQSDSATARPELSEESPTIDSERISLAVKSIEKNPTVNSNRLEFAIDEDSGQTIIKVLDPETKEVIRQLPSQEVLALAASLEQLNADDVITGLLLDNLA